MQGYAVNDIPRSGVENMALDQAMLETAASLGCPLLRVYRWSEPTISLGYFQPYAQRQAHAASSDIAAVRRATGGGAIVHHFDWTYCVAIPDTLKICDGHGNAKNSSAAAVGASQILYNCVHAAVVEWLARHRSTARLWSEECGLPAFADEPGQQRFLCFQRRSCGDIVLGSSKVLGSAQRRIFGAVLQHGSLLLATSPYAPSLQGLLDLGDGIDFSDQQAHIEFASSVQTAAEVVFGSNVRPLESFFNMLCETISVATGCNMIRAESLTQMPWRWSWPRETKFGLDTWTRRL